METTFRRDASDPKYFIASSNYLDECIYKSRGSEGQIYECNIDGQPFALKVFSMININNRQKWLSRKTKKLEFMLDLPPHRNFVTIHGLVRIESCDEVCSAYLMTPLFQCTTLTKIVFPNHPMHGQRIQKLIELSDAMEWAHSQGLFIGDIKENNVLLNPEQEYLPIFIDRDNYALCNLQQEKFIPYNTMPDVLFPIIVSQKYTVPQTAAELKKLYRAYDIEVFTFMALRIITIDERWEADEIPPGMIKKELNTLLRYDIITKEESDEFKLLLSDSLDKPMPAHVLKKIQSRNPWWLQK